MICKTTDYVKLKDKSGFTKLFEPGSTVGTPVSNTLELVAGQSYTVTSPLGYSGIVDGSQIVKAYK